MGNRQRNLNDSEKDNLRNAAIIGARYYNHFLLNKTFLIVTDALEEYEITFRKKDFNHLTGIRTNLSDNLFFDYCLKGIFARNNIKDVQKYNYKTLKDKSVAIKKLNKFLHSDASTNLFIVDLETKTRFFPVAINNDKENITLAFVDGDLHARSLRKARQSQNFKKSNQIMLILSKNKEDNLYETIIYIRDKSFLKKVQKKFYCQDSGGSMV